MSKSENLDYYEKCKENRKVIHARLDSFSRLPLPLVFKTICSEFCGERIGEHSKVTPVSTYWPKSRAARRGQ